jgi:8-oxo-dGTP pyrophosphatase MutT (NUDIX family)
MRQRIKQALSDRNRKVIIEEHLTRAAVLLPLYEKEGECFLIFTKRTEEVTFHKGQISFPGGSCEREDRTAEDAALRETFEEIGVRARDVEILGELDDEATTTNFIISPFVGVIPYPYQFRISRSEIGEIIEVPVSALLNRDNFREESQIWGGKPVPVYFYQYNRHVIWGATARVLKGFLDLVSAL